jgi:hypothetical protein
MLSKGGRGFLCSTSVLKSSNQTRRVVIAAPTDILARNGQIVSEKALLCFLEDKDDKLYKAGRYLLMLFGR